MRLCQGYMYIDLIYKSCPLINQVISQTLYIYFSIDSTDTSLLNHWYEMNMSITFTILPINILLSHIWHTFLRPI